VIPITWRNRRYGVSKLKIKEMGSRYLFIALYCWLEKYFSRGDYRQKHAESGPAQELSSQEGVLHSGKNGSDAFSSGSGPGILWERSGSANSAIK
jgi:hypothetical protein